MKISKSARNALFLGILCPISYLAVYITRNILSAVTPQMLASGAFTENYIGNLSSVYLVFYAIGQLINGILGDRIKAKYMISFGLLLAGISNFFFPKLTHLPNAAVIVYGVTGFFLAMIYAPMTKVVAENTEHKYAVRCSLAYTFASFFGSPLAGILAASFVWGSVFDISSIVLAIMAVICFLCFILFEKFGIVKYGVYDKKQKGKGNIKLLLEHKFIKYSLVSFLTGVIRTSVVFWLPTYISQALGFSPDSSALLFTVATFGISLAAFIAVFVHKLLGNNMDRTVLYTFAASGILFIGVYFFKNPIINIALMVLAIIAANCTSTILWSWYCPSLRDTGMVSGATGFLDFVSYVAAALSNMIFGNAVSVIGWGNLILMWATLMFVGVLVSIIKRPAIKGN